MEALEKRLLMVRTLSVECTALFPKLTHYQVNKSVSMFLVISSSMSCGKNHPVLSRNICQSLNEFYEDMLERTLMGRLKMIVCSWLSQQKISYLFENKNFDRLIRDHSSS